MQRRKRVLITGGAGFIGSHLAARFLARDDIVHALVRPTTSTRRLDRLAGRIEVHRACLSDEDVLNRIFAKVQPEQVIHLAVPTRRAAEPDLSDIPDSITEDLLQFVKLLKVAASARPAPELVIRTGSLAEYGACRAPFEEGQRELPLDSYAAALVASTHYARMLQRRLPFPVLTARLALVYGPDQSSEFLVPLLIQRCLAGEKAVVRHPSDRRDLMHVDDAVEAILRLAAMAVPAGTLVNIGTGCARSMREVADLIVQATGADPHLVEFGSDAASSGIRELRAKTDLAQAQLGWSARIPLATGLRQTVRWYRDRQPVKETIPC